MKLFKGEYHVITPGPLGVAGGRTEVEQQAMFQLDDARGPVHGAVLSWPEDDHLVITAWTGR